MKKFHRFTALDGNSSMKALLTATLPVQAWNRFQRLSEKRIDGVKAME